VTGSRIEPELIHAFSEPLRGPDGTLYRVVVRGQERDDGTWIGWLEFTDPSANVLQTERETTQSSAEQVKYWATGLELTYLDGALERARRN
jgi:hypothetical protein